MSPKSRAREIRTELRVLKKLSRALADVKPPPGSADRMRGYRRRLAAQIFLDGRIVRAAKVEDEQAIAVGIKQNEINRQKRTSIAKRLGFSRCLRDAGAR